MSKNHSMQVPIFIGLTLIANFGTPTTTVGQRPLVLATRHIVGYYRKSDDSSTLVNTVDGRTFEVVETPDQIEAML